MAENKPSLPINQLEYKYNLKAYNYELTLYVIAPVGSYPRETEVIAPYRSTSRLDA